MPLRPPEPDAVEVIAFYGEIPIIVEGSSITDLIAEYAELVTVETVEAIVGTDPHKAFVVLVYVHNGVVRQAVFNTQVFYRFVVGVQRIV